MDDSATNTARYTPNKLAKKKTFREAMKLTDFEIFVSMAKFTIAIGIFNRPMLYLRSGIVYGLITDISFVIIINLCNYYLIRCLVFMPKGLTTIESKLTFGKVVKYILDNREARINQYNTKRFT